MRKALVLAAVMVMALTAGVFAESGKYPMMGKGMGIHEGGMAGGPKMILAMASELNLTADQMDKLKKLIDSMPEKGANKDELMKDKEALEAEMQKDKPDQAKIDALIDKIADKKKAMIKHKLKVKAEIDAILTKEQKEILKKKIEEKKKGFEGKKEGCKGMK